MTFSSAAIARGSVVRPLGLGLVLWLALFWSGALGRCHGAALQWGAEGTDGVRSAPVAPVGSGKTGFKLLSSPEAGITFTNRLSQGRYITNQIYLNGAGVAAGDVDGDGLCDLYFCGIDRPNVLYRNLGNWKFEDVTARAGVDCANMSSSGCTFADLDGDGDLDLLVNTVGNGTLIYFNDGKGQFRRAGGTIPLNHTKAGMSLALADVDGDGDLDLYIANYRTTTLRDMPNTRLKINEVPGGLKVTAVNDRPVTEPDLVGRFTVDRQGGLRENGEVDLFCLNDGKGQFTPVLFTSGAFLDEDGQPLKEPPYDWGLTVRFHDINRDGAPDIYVCNDFESPDRIWINNGKGQFRALPRLGLRVTSIFSMGIDFADIDRDGRDDFFVSDMLSRDHAKRMLELGDIQPVHLPIGAIDNRPQYSHNTLFWNRGDGTYAEISQFAGVHASEWTWSPNFMDVDLDGYEDLLITTGHELQMMNADIIEKAEVLKSQKQMSNYELQRLRTMFPRYAIPNALFRNRGDRTFEDVSTAWGFDTPDVGNALAVADLDNDGDLDVVINNLNGLAELFRFEGAAARIAVRLKGLPPNTQGIGARITVLGGAVPQQSQEVVCAGHYLSGSEPTRVFAAGSATNRLTIEVAWRSGRRSIAKELPANRLYEIDEAKAGPPVAAQAAAAPTEPMFEDVSELIGHRHHEDPFDDFTRQPLLPNRLSLAGPGLSWLDVNDDGWDDLLAGSGKGGQLGCFINQTNGAFVRKVDGPVTRQLGRDQTTVLGLRSTLIAGSSNYEDGLTNGGCLRIYDLQRQATGENIRGELSSAGPLAFGDVDNDGDLDLFVGGRVVPGRYPEPATSLLLRKDGDRLVIGQRFERLGLVSGAVFSDLDGDGTLELVLACEWGPIRVFRWRTGSFEEATRELGLAGYTGWWNGVATGDLDGDGRLDIVASNWGLNTMYRASPERPRRIYYADIDDSGTLDVIEAFINPTTGAEAPSRGFRAVRAAIPSIQERISSYEAYGQATLADIYGEAFKPAQKVEAVTPVSTVFFNRGERFEAAEMPAEAQWAPAFGICVADVNGDGNEDVFLSQNFFAVNPDEWRGDAGRGLWLRGDGTGRLTPLSGQESGVKVYGDQRGCAVADYDGDGRVDLAVGQNGNATKLFHNRGAQPGLRVRLAGSILNPQAIGASLRLKSGDRLGPVREVQAGSGYWSCNSAVQVMSMPGPSARTPTHLWVRWPGGQTTTNAIPEAAKEIRVTVSGELMVVR